MNENLNTMERYDENRKYCILERDTVNSTRDILDLGNMLVCHAGRSYSNAIPFDIMIVDLCQMPSATTYKEPEILHGAYINYIQNDTVLVTFADGSDSITVDLNRMCIKLLDLYFKEDESGITTDNVVYFDKAFFMNYKERLSYEYFYIPIYF